MFLVDKWSGANDWMETARAPDAPARPSPREKFCTPIKAKKWRTHMILSSLPMVHVHRTRLGTTVVVRMATVRFTTGKPEKNLGSNELQSVVVVAV